jgi:hypothetical protein
MNAGSIQFCELDRRGAQQLIIGARRSDQPMRLGLPCAVADALDDVLDWNVHQARWSGLPDETRARGPALVSD